ncbi:PAP2 domain-containing protein [Exophiala viscosa]|uniref:PAP2 domain-containing protein n=1 Tax=Exophiala viscosa TaxID=2486360 RepID=A0AAN6DSE3_9EURO|nr:PAP2 domain-containing protein [Exophiala viscosa]KAI1628863.1 PAP2 domain-containing protein [Exophiala viscosa]
MRQATNGATGLAGSIQRFWQRSYAPDYVGFLLVLLALIGQQLLVEPFHQMFTLDNHAKQYPHAEIQRVSSSQNILYAGVGPLVFLILWAVLVRPGVHRVHVTILGLFISLFLTTLLTDIVKNAIGRPRPDLIARCKPRLGTPEHELVTISVCTETDHHTLHDGWRSFPSGHSSWAFSGLGYLALFLAGQLHVLRPSADLARVLIVLAPLVGAALIAMSRLADYRHDVYDVTVGSLLGMSVAYLTYRRYYRPLRHPKCEVPYPSRAEYVSAMVGSKAKDLERQLNEDFSLDDLSEDEAQAVPLTEVRPGRSGQEQEQEHTAGPP